MPLRAPFALLLLPVLLGSFAPAPAAAAPGLGDLLVAPTRLVFEGRDRNAELTLVNVGNQPATYRISFVELRMDETGATRQLSPEDAQSPEPGERFSSGLIRFFPRQVTLEPKVAQTLRLQLRPPAGGLEDGEYRSHLLLRAIPEGAELTDAPAGQGLSVSLKAIYGVSIPILVRHGALTAEARLADLRLAPPALPGALPILSFRLERSGDASLFGNLEATFHPLHGKPVPVGEVNGVAVYTPNLSRKVSLSLHLPAAAASPLTGSLQLTYETADGEILAVSELSLP